MIGKIIGAFAGAKAAKATRGIDGPMGAMLGVVATTALRRMSIPTMLALTAGGYAAKKMFDKAGDPAVPSPEKPAAPEGMDRVPA